MTISMFGSDQGMTHEWCDNSTRRPSASTTVWPVRPHCTLGPTRTSSVTVNSVPGGRSNVQVTVGPSLEQVEVRLIDRDLDRTGESALRRHVDRVRRRDAASSDASESNARGHRSVRTFDRRALHAEQPDHPRGDEDHHRAEERTAPDQTATLGGVTIVVGSGFDVACPAVLRT
jgi:hypothetical protein